MNLFEKAEEIAKLLKQAADLEVAAKKKKKEPKMEAEADKDPLDVTPEVGDTFPGVNDAPLPEGADTTAPAAPAAATSDESTAISNGIKESLKAGGLMIDAVKPYGEQIKQKYPTKEEFDTFVDQITKVLDGDPEIKGLGNWNVEEMKKTLNAYAPEQSKKDTETPVAKQPADDATLADASNGLNGGNEVSTAIPPSTELASTPETGSDNADPLADSGVQDSDLLGDDPLKESKNSLFDYLTKTAYDVNQLAGEAVLDKKPETLEAFGVNPAEKQSILNYCAGRDHENAQQIAAEYHDSYQPKASMDAIAAIIEESRQGNPVVASLETKQMKVDAFLKDIHEYKADTSVEDAILSVAKTASDASDFLNKIATQESLLTKKAVKLDEPSASPQHPGKKLFNSDVVSYTNGKQQYWPGQKVTQTRDGGNATVVSVFNFKGKPDVDVYTNKAGRKDLTSINTVNGGTIAFMQPMKEAPVEISKPVDTTGVVTGEVQKNPGLKEQQGGAGHTTQNYLDQAFKLADKSKVAGDLPGAKASVEAPIAKTASSTEAFFHFSMEKKAFDTMMTETQDGTSVGSTSIASDTAVGPAADPKANKIHTLSSEEVVAAQKKFTEDEGKLVASAAGPEDPTAQNPLAGMKDPADDAAKKDPKKDDKKDPLSATKPPLDIPEGGDKKKDPDQLRDPGTVQDGEYEKVKAILQSLPIDKQNQLQEVADNPSLFKEKMQEILVLTNPGQEVPALNEEGYKKLADDLYGVKPNSKPQQQAPKPAPGKKAEPEQKGLGAGPEAGAAAGGKDAAGGDSLDSMLSQLGI